MRILNRHSTASDNVPPRCSQPWPLGASLCGSAATRSDAPSPSRPATRRPRRLAGQNAGAISAWAATRERRGRRAGRRRIAARRPREWRELRQPLLPVLIDCAMCYLCVACLGELAMHSQQSQRNANKRRRLPLRDVDTNERARWWAGFVRRRALHVTTRQRASTSSWSSRCTDMAGALSRPRCCRRPQPPPLCVVARHVPRHASTRSCSLACASRPAPVRAMAAGSMRWFFCEDVRTAAVGPLPGERQGPDCAAAAADRPRVAPSTTTTDRPRAQIVHSIHLQVLRAARHGASAPERAAAAALFLHVYHHAVVLLMAWSWLEYRQTLQFGGLLFNTAVHVLMYYYYFRRVLGCPCRGSARHTVPDRAVWHLRCATW